MSLDDFTMLFAFSSEGHEIVTRLGIALAVARLVVLGKTAVLAKLRELYLKADTPAGRSSGVWMDQVNQLKKCYQDEMETSADGVDGPMRFFADLPLKVVGEDIHPGNIPGIGESLERDSQVRHFMRSRSDVSSDDAYKASVQYIRDHCTLAWKALAQAFRDVDNPPPSGNRGDLLAKDTAGVLNELAKALHTLEDSYAPGHVERDGHESIGEVHIWDDANKKPDPSAGWDGHSALDNPANPNSAPHFRTARYAVHDLLLCVLSNADKAEGDFQTELKGVIASRFARL